MLTQQEAIAQLNDRIVKSKLKPTSAKLIAKIKFLEEQIAARLLEIKSFSYKIKELENEVLRTRGAVSILLELAAEDEGLLTEDSETLDKSIK
jgi:hypothetical protein